MWTIALWNESSKEQQKWNQPKHFCTILRRNQRRPKLTIRGMGDVAALERSHMNGLLSFESTIEQTTETMPLATKQ